MERKKQALSPTRYDHVCLRGFFLQSPSFLAIQRLMQHAHRVNNAKNFFDVMSFPATIKFAIYSISSSRVCFDRYFRPPLNIWGSESLSNHSDASIIYYWFLLMVQAIFTLIHFNAHRVVSRITTMIEWVILTMRWCPRLSSRSVPRSFPLNLSSFTRKKATGNRIDEENTELCQCIEPGKINTPTIHNVIWIWLRNQIIKNIHIMHFVVDYLYTWWQVTAQV